MNSARSKPAEPLMEKDKGGGGGVAGGVELAVGTGGHGEAILNVTQTLACRRVLFPTFLIDNDNNSGDIWKHRRPIKGLCFAQVLRSCGLRASDRNQNVSHVLFRGAQMKRWIIK